MLLNPGELAEKNLSYAEMADALEELYKLDHHPVAVKFFWTEEEYNNFKADKIPDPPASVCQIALAARINDRTVKANMNTMGCGNAKICFGWATPTETTVEGHAKFAADLAHAKDCLMAKPTLTTGKLKGFMTAPLGKTTVDPDVVFMVVNPWQAYHIMNNYMAAKKVPDLQFSHTINSAVCGGMVRCYNDQQSNMNTMCAGSHTTGRTEKGELNIFIPGADIGGLVQELLRHTAKYGTPWVAVLPGQEWPSPNA